MNDITIYLFFLGTMFSTHLILIKSCLENFSPTTDNENTKLLEKRNNREGKKWRTNMFVKPEWHSKLTLNQLLSHPKLPTDFSNMSRKWNPCSCLYLFLKTSQITVLDSAFTDTLLLSHWENWWSSKPVWILILSKTYNAYTKSNIWFMKIQLCL